MVLHNLRPEPPRSDIDSDLSVARWEAYYRGGAIASCPMGPTSSYTLELRELWLAFFGTLNEGARIVDVGTGNDAIALMAKKAAANAGTHFQIHGADLAATNPARHVPDGAALFAGIAFHPGMPTERLAFESGTFDAVSGQFALEYTDVGRAQFVLHHEQSALIRNARESLAHGALVLEETKILRKLRRHVDAERDSAAAARVTWAALSEAATQLQQAAASSSAPHVLHVVLDGVQKLLGIRRQMSAAAFEREVDRFERDVRAAVRRLQHLVGCAQSSARMELIVTTGRRLGFECGAVQEQFHAGDNLVGWRLSLFRP